MNYIKEINAFYDWLELNSVRPSTVILWHTLMHLNNKSGWAEEFTVARSVIEAKTGLKKDAYYTARNQLRQLGRIDFKERGTKATAFKMVSLSSEFQTTTQTTKTALSEKQTTTQTTIPTTTQTTIPTTTQTVTKLNKTKLNKTKERLLQTGLSNVHENPVVVVDDGFASLTNFYEQNIGPITPMIGDELGEMCDMVNSELALLALKESVRANAGNKIKYTLTILRNWKAQNFKSVADVEQHEDRKRNQSQSRRNNVTSLFEASPETLERQQRENEKHAGREIDLTNLL